MCAETIEKRRRALQKTAPPCNVGHRAHRGAWPDAWQPAAAAAQWELRGARLRRGVRRLEPGAGEFHADVSAEEVQSAVNRMESGIRARFPEMRRIYIEARRVDP